MISAVVLCRCWVVGVFGLLVVFGREWLVYFGLSDRTVMSYHIPDRLTIYAER
jgi:hypothetical protein